MSMRGRTVAVAGGGIAGMAAALLLARAGASVTLVERVAAPEAVGAGLLLQPNGLAVLGGLGLGEELERGAHRLDDGLALRDASGTVLVRSPAPDFGPGLDHLLAVRRSHLHGVLLAAVERCPAITVHLGVEVTGARPDGHVELSGPSGTWAATGEVVVVADGVGSTVRDHGDFGASVRPSGAHYVLGLVPGTDLGLDGEFWTRLGLFGGVGVDHAGSYLYAATHAPAVARAVARRDLSEFRALWAQALPPAGAALERVASWEDLLVTEVRRVDCERWVDGRLVLVGDAAHAMAPNLGQGANSALVDAAVLAVGLAADQPVEQALCGYGERRRRPVRRVQNFADRLALASRLTNPMLRSLRDAGLRRIGRAERWMDRQARSVQQEDPAWLYSMVRSLDGPRPAGAPRRR
ncbi:MAG TPA: NAD(P)/FAD-dependent oxidoreductase [Actinomycetes bacterium]|nr:NAD(P)/FAD-dependent oxidoreductase [Actinomycetes bacterium]